MLSHSASQAARDADDDDDIVVNEEHGYEGENDAVAAVENDAVTDYKARMDSNDASLGLDKDGETNSNE